MVMRTKVKTKAGAGLPAQTHGCRLVHVEQPSILNFFSKKNLVSSLSPTVVQGISEQEAKGRRRKREASGSSHDEEFHDIPAGGGKAGKEKSGSADTGRKTDSDQGGSEILLDLKATRDPSKDVKLLGSSSKGPLPVSAEASPSPISEAGSEDNNKTPKPVPAGNNRGLRSAREETGNARENTQARSYVEADGGAGGDLAQVEHGQELKSTCPGGSGSSKRRRGGSSAEAVIEEAGVCGSLPVQSSGRDEDGGSDAAGVNIDGGTVDEGGSGGCEREDVERSPTGICSPCNAAVGDGSGEAHGGGDSHEGWKRQQREEHENRTTDRDEEEEDDAAHGANEVSEYELQRMERIRRNQAFMATLGLGEVKPPKLAATPGVGSGGAAAKRSKKRKSVSREGERAPAPPLRRSTRARGGEAVNYSESTQDPHSVASMSQPEPEPEEVDFDDSTVLKYLCRADVDARGARDCDTLGSGSSDVSGAGDRRLVGVRLLDPDRPLSASGLSTIYTMHFCRGGGPMPPLLAAGGKGGVVAVFSTQVTAAPAGSAVGGDNEARNVDDEDEDDEDEDDEDERTLLNFKGHAGWVSAVRFVDDAVVAGRSEGGEEGREAGSCRLLSSANDSTVKLWDASKQHQGMPKLLCANSSLHPTRRGIFCMDVKGLRVATGSKDTTVGVATLTPAGIVPDRAIGVPGGSEAFHERVVKGVDLRDELTLASCGDDGAVRVCDLRDLSGASFGVSCRIDAAHDGSCHTVRWHPSDANLLLTAGLDSTIKLYDLRRASSPVHVFRGHCPYVLPRPKAIHRPEFLPLGAGRFGVVTCGERSDKLSMYDAVTGSAVSRGTLGAEVRASWASDRGKRVVAAVFERLGLRQEAISSSLPFDDSQAVPGGRCEVLEGVCVAMVPEILAGLNADGSDCSRVPSSEHGSIGSARRRRLLGASGAPLREKAAQ